MMSRAFTPSLSLWVSNCRSARPTNAGCANTTLVPERSRSSVASRVVFTSEMAVSVGLTP